MIPKHPHCLPMTLGNMRGPIRQHFESEKQRQCDRCFMTLQSRGQSEQKYDRDFLLSPDKRNQLVLLWEIEQ